jgi:hypothetical protein
LPGLPEEHIKNVRSSLPVDYQNRVGDQTAFNDQERHSKDI